MFDKFDFHREPWEGEVSSSDYFELMCFAHKFNYRVDISGDILVVYKGCGTDIVDNKGQRVKALAEYVWRSTEDLEYSAWSILKILKGEEKIYSVAENNKAAEAYWDWKRKFL